MARDTVGERRGIDCQVHPEVERQEQTHLRIGRERWQAWAALESLIAKGMVLDGAAAWCGDRPGVMALRGVADAVRRKPVSPLGFCVL